LIWLVSFVATVGYDVMQGLAISIGFALMTTVFRTQWSRWHLLANLTGTNDYRDSERYHSVTHYDGICVLRFDSPLLFTNVDRFKRAIYKVSFADISEVMVANILNSHSGQSPSVAPPISPLLKKIVSKQFGSIFGESNFVFIT
uniref:SLC26A/SulP transporter domain-containing protein n=1 Tax=Parascaris univalens TaxID=6257 RepID=A0A914ZVJ6_PARUN